MVDILPIKTIDFNGSPAPSEFEPGDTVPISQGGTGATIADDARENLGAVYGSNLTVAESTTVSSTSSTPSTNNNITVGTFPQTYLTLTTENLPVNPSAVYQLEVSYFWSYNATTTDFLGRCNRNSGTQLFGFHRQEPKDASGNAGDTPTGSGTNQRHPAYYTQTFTGLSGVQTFDLEFASGSNEVTSTIISAVLIFKRIS